MKNLFFLFISLLSFWSQAQEPIVAIEYPNMNILYRGYSNKVILAVSDADMDKIILTGENCTIEKINDHSEYIIKPGKGRIVVLNVALKSGDEIVVLKRSEYKVFNVPDPQIYWGAKKSGEVATSYVAQIYAKYPPEIPLVSTFSVSEWTVIVEKDTIKGMGNDISKAQRIFKTISQPTLVIIEAKVMGEDGIYRKMSGHWTVDKWIEPKMKHAVAE